MLPMMYHRARPVLFNDPFAALDRISRLFDNGGECRAAGLPACHVDVREDGEHLYFTAELPGVAKNDLEITLEDGVLTIAGEKKDEHSERKDGFHLQERRYGRFSRSFRLPTDVDPNEVNASLKDGLLTVTLNKAEAAKPRKIEVKPG
jgi:HSP20 family protein